MSDLTLLPIYQHQDEINDALLNHQVIVVEGPTGCGKTTQLPRILLRNANLHGRIGLTQPRRIAAVSVAARIAQEIGSQVGETVGYAIRFDDQTSAETIVKVMTDGILLQESRSDHLYSNYQIIIIDEAHERSLNIDLALGLLRMAIDERPDLRVIISSATIRAETFQRYFSRTGDGKDVPLISIKSRTYPVEISYRALEGRDRYEMPQALVEEVMRIHQEGEEGHILCFLPGQGTIMSCQEMLQTAQATKKGFSDLLILPLYGSLSRADQERVFEETPGRRKVILSTNIAETSITIPDVRFVIDSGIAKIPRYNPKTNVTTLREEGISQASLAQRAGRAGRTAPGKCIRLFDEELLDERVDFTDEEITRLNLSEVMLRLIDIGVQDIEHFPFPTRPATAGIRDALAELRKLEAIDNDNKLTQIGQKMVVFPLSPRLARVVVEAGTKYPGLLRDVIVATAWLSVKSPMLYPPNHETQARSAHARLAHPMGDLLTAIGIVKRYEESDDKAKYCFKNYLDPDTMAFISKSTIQIQEMAETVGLIHKGAGPENDVIRAFLCAYTDQCLVLRGRSYIAQSDINAVLHPSSSLHQSMPKLIMALEFIQSTRTYAEKASVVRSAWLKEYGIDIQVGSDRPRSVRQEYGADRKKMRRLERKTESATYVDRLPKAVPSARKLFRVDRAEFKSEERAPHVMAPKSAPKTPPKAAAKTPKLASKIAAKQAQATEITIAGLSLKNVSTSGRQRLLILNLDDLRTLSTVPIDSIEYAKLLLRASLRHPQGKVRILNNYRLGAMLKLAGPLRLLTERLEIPKYIPLGASLSLSANLRVLSRSLDALCSFHYSPRGQSGWLSLSSAEELFWFELCEDPLDAVRFSNDALERLTDHVTESQTLAALEISYKKLKNLQKTIENAIID